MSLVEVRKEKYIGYIVLNRPEKLNALNMEIYKLLGEAVDEVEVDDEIRVVVIKGEGRCFSAGYDINELATGDHLELRRNYDRYAHKARLKIWNLPKPTIAQVHSHCLGGAHDVALACDFCIVAENANMGVPEIQFGSGATFLALPYMIPLRRCREYLLTGKTYDGPKAFELGIANRCVPLEELDSAVKAFAKSLAMVPVPSMQLQKRGINRAVEAMGFALVMEQWLDYSSLGTLWKSEDIEEFNRQVAEKGVKAALKWRELYYENIIK